jgi:hypothetical protein
MNLSGMPLSAVELELDGFCIALKHNKLIGVKYRTIFDAAYVNGSTLPKMTSNTAGFYCAFVNQWNNLTTTKEWKNYIGLDRDIIYWKGEIK